MHNSKKILFTSFGIFLASLILSSSLPYHHFLNSICSVAGTIAFVFFIVGLIRLMTHRSRRATPKEDLSVDKMNHKMLAHYQKAGLSESDIVFFRKTMKEAEDQIRQLSQNVSNTPKLKTIDSNVDFVKVSKSMFAAIVKEPQRVSESGASDFLYRHLPTLVNLTDRYIEISHHEVKTTDTWEVLAKSLAVIKNLGNQIREDYSIFVSDDLNEMDQEISAATDSLSSAQKDAIKMSEALEKVNNSYEKSKEQH